MPWLIAFELILYQFLHVHVIQKSLFIFERRRHFIKQIMSKGKNFLSWINSNFWILDSTYLSAFADLNWNDISDADLAMFNMVPPVPSPAISTPTLNVNSNPLANLVSPPPPSTTLPSSLPNCRDNLLYQMQDNGSSVVPSIPRPTTLAPKLRPLSISSENLSRSNRRNRNKHHLIDLNSNLPDTNANVEQERVANSKKEQVLQLFKMNSPEQAGGVVHGRSQSLVSVSSVSLFLFLLCLKFCVWLFFFFFVFRFVFGMHLALDHHHITHGIDFPLQPALFESATK